MRSLSSALLIALLALAVPGLGQESAVLVGTVIKVTDGDTIQVSLQSGPIKVRLHAVDTPESYGGAQPWGKKAAKALRQRVLRREVALEVSGQSSYDRIVAEVYLGDESINEWLVASGNAWVAREYERDPARCRLEAEARAERLGLWSLPADKVIAPWEWRHRKQLPRGFTDYSGETVENCIAALGQQDAPQSQTAPSVAAPVEPQAAQGDCHIKGNISSRGKIYHVPGSPSYNATKVDESKGERWFCTEDEAKAAGWRPRK